MKDEGGGKIMTVCNAETKTIQLFEYKKGKCIKKCVIKQNM